MKLAATFCVAALSLAGCADVETTNGGHLAGMRPAKPSIDNPNDSPLPQNPDFSKNGVQQAGMFDLPPGASRNPGLSAETIKDGDYPLPNNVCDGCEVTLIKVPARSASEVGEIFVVNDGGNQLCQIFLNQDGTLDTSDCER